MDKFVDDQLYRGMDKFHLANSVQDGSYLSELLCGEMFVAAGVPASRCGHAVVTINGRKRGLYYLKEGYDSHFLRRHFGNSHGNFYDGGFLRDVDQPLQLISGKDDVPVHTDLKALVEAAREKDVAKRFARMEKVLDMEKFLSFLALEVITGDWDGYPMKPNNYRLYHDPERDKIVFIPSGMDQMFGDTGWPLAPGFSGLVARKLMETTEGKKRYTARMKEVVKTVFVPDRWVKRLDELEKRVQPELGKADAGAGRDYKNHVDRLRNAITARAKNLDEQLKRLKD
jgi:spore coat protein CotH